MIMDRLSGALTKAADSLNVTFIFILRAAK